MTEPWFELILVILLILANGAFAMAEMAMVSARKVRLQQQAEEGDSSAKAALDLVDNPNRLLSTVQVGISLIGVLSGAVGGAALSDDLALVIARVPTLAPYSGVIALIVVVFIITYLSLVVGELIPKRLALGDPEAVAMRMAKPMQAISWLLRPAIGLLSRSTDLGIKIIGVKESDEPAVTEEDVRGMLRQGTLGGVFETTEQNIVESVFRLSDRTVDALMTPRTEIVWLDVDEPFEHNLRIVLDSRHSRFPVARGNLDNVLGILHTKDLLVSMMEESQVNLLNLLIPPVFIPESLPAFKVLEEVKRTGISTAMILDEYGGVSGMVTMTDIMRSIVGQIPSSGEPFEPQAMQREDGSWLFDGLILVDELKEILNIQDLPDESRIGYQTLGGLIMSQIGQIPSVGQYFEWELYRFEVVDMDGHRVDKVLVTPLKNNRNFTSLVNNSIKSG